MCRPGQQRSFGVARQEEARISCEVEANPSNVKFSWKFNNSAESVNIAEKKFSVDRTRSTVSYSPASDWEFGSLLCWARNDLGKQKEPCVFSVMPAGEYVLLTVNLLEKTVLFYFNRTNLKMYLKTRRT